MKIANQFALKQNPSDRLAELDGQLKNASRLYESHFLNEMVKAMRSTIHRDDGFIKPNMAENIFSEQLDQQYVEQWADKGGIGLADMIYQQLHERIFPDKKDFSKPAGPLPLHKTSAPMRIQVDKKSGAAGQILFHGQTTSPLVQPSEVVSPWKGKITAVNTDLEGWKHLTLNHDNNIESRLVFRGALEGLESGRVVEMGERLGVLSSEKPVLRWDVKLV